jgi:UDP-N-acetylmuramoyl-L-alanyl-D-glutamate--2,6-diaminopimelate ligase
MRDQDKRPKMWEVVHQLSDIIILTDDDPDKEDRFQIIEQVKKWIKRNLWDDFWIIPDRELAIQLAYNISKKQDIVLIAGKWHETVQLTNLWKKHYSDIEILQKLINN